MADRNHENDQTFGKTRDDKRARRRKLYRVMPPNKKEALLARRHTNIAELKRRRLTESSISVDAANASSSNATNVSTNQGSLNIRDSLTFSRRRTGYVFTEPGCSSSMQAENTYVKLKDSSKCQFCIAKKFEYEPPAFCCGNGSIQLISHEMPTKLRKLYLGNIEESKHFRTYN
nr:uncharacterized protein LOC108943529 [Nicotiana tomentosiformis]